MFYRRVMHNFETDLSGSVSLLTPGQCSDALEFQFQLKVRVYLIATDIVEL